MDGDRPIDRVLALAGARGWNQSELARQMGVDPANITNWKARGLPSDQYAGTAAALGCTIDEIVRGTGGGSLGSAEPPSTFGIIRAWEHADDLPPGEFVFVPRMGVKLSAGTGRGRNQLEIDFQEAQPQAFRADWIRKERLKPNKLASMYAVGNSMEPSIFDGDSLVIDISQTEVIDGKVYALWYEGGERVKRLFRVPGGALRIQSDNTDYPPLNLSADQLEHVRILGRVVHRAGKGGL